MQLKAFSGAAAVVALALVVGSCGIKPGKVDPPPNARPDTFPHTYPDPTIELK